MKYLYEKDLRQMKYNILTSTRHDMVVRQIARRLGIGEQKMRMILIRTFDMSLLENLEARYEMGLLHADTDDPVARKLGCELFTDFIPLVAPEAMQSIYEDVRTHIASGTQENSAIDEGLARIREVIR
ncbi:DUF1959 domain-containing protein [Methanoculleus sp. FWC-SCC1]|uniref:DUF1959 domain-containing protein n=1 Tax=Methanoculleus frigidifontis TaxID=2584085 RepID=A0ABT8M5Y4_9EURY|nr:DUF1959 family protein [Methanoculleus sp. FWC-SCC1]MDN7023333.1 DUF1959 domain-containing protein [Methanoculleus sp. FWC-SCC1]